VEDALAYDAVGRLTERRYGDGTFKRLHYRPDGALLQAENEFGVVAFDRDKLGRIVKERQGDHSVTSCYGMDGLRCLVETSLGAHQVILRDALGEVQALHLGPDKPRQSSIEFERDNGGLEEGRRLLGGVHVEWQRDLAGRPASRRTIHRTPAGAVETHALTYHWAGDDQLRELVDSRMGTTTYTHDGRGRLIREERSGTTLHRAMDIVGNVYRTADRRDRRHSSGGRLETANGSVYTHDVGGKLIQRQEPGGETWKYKWNGAGLLREVERPDGLKVRFEYDAFARRTRKITVRAITDGVETIQSAVRFIWDGSVVIHELAGPESPTTWYWQPGTFAPLAKETKGRYWSIVSDHLGTPSEMYDEGGQLAWRMQLDTFGVGRKDVALEKCPWRWPGQYEDEETGLHYNRFRYYDPATGAYISPDPLGPSGGTHLWRYVRDPLSWSDPLGLAGTPCASESEDDGAETVPMYRAVSPDEFDDIMATGSFRPVPSGLQGKQFGLDLDETIRFANQFPDLAAIVRVNVPRSTFNQFDFSTSIDPFIFRSGVVTVQPGAQQTALNNTLTSIEHVF
jgi:RHS repeat-associated protein